MSENEKKQIVVILALLVVLVVVWIVVLQPSKKKADADGTEEDGLELKVILETAEEYFKEKETVQEIFYEQDKDPFSLEKRNVSAEGKPAAFALEGLILQGILWNAQKPLAIINEEMIREGDFVKGAHVKKIEKDHVILEAEGNEKILFIEGVKGESDKKQEDKKPKMEVGNEKDIPILVY